MRFQNVCVESIGYVLPAEILTSAEIERRLQPLYDRLRLPTGRLELMSGIGERRLWREAKRPSTLSIRSGELAIEAAGIDRQQIGALIHGSVCRDYLEPATACPVHHGLRLRPDCLVYDTSNACLGMLNGIVQAANMIELGQIPAALIAGTENARGLIEATLQHLNDDPRWTRQQIKPAMASLTIGSASCAVLLTHRQISQTQNRLLGGVALANTAFHELCLSTTDLAGAGMHPLMNTDAERLMQEGVETGRRTLDRFLNELEWTRSDLDLTIGHQVGSAHRRLMLQTLELDARRDLVTFPWLGNTGSAALPVTWAIGLQTAAAERRRLALLGIGSGINCMMLGVEWCVSRIAGQVEGAWETPFSAASLSDRGVGVF